VGSISVDCKNVFALTTESLIAADLKFF